MDGTLRLILAVLSALIGGALLVQAYVGTFARYQWDDFCFTAGSRVSSLPSMESFVYTHWYGRFSAVFLLWVSAHAGPHEDQLVPALLILCWSAALIWMVRCAGDAADLHVPLCAAFPLAGTMILATVEATPNAWQSIDWQISAFAYTAPLILSSFLAGVLCRASRPHQRRRPGLLLRMIAAAMLALLAAGCSETAASALSCVLAAICVLSVLEGGAARRTLLPLLGSACAGALGALALMKLAPGNAIRAQVERLPPTLPIRSIALISIHFGQTFLVDNVLTHWPLLLAATLVPATIVALCPGTSHTLDGEEVEARRRVAARLLVATPCVVLVVLPLSFVPAVYAMANRPPDRAMVVAEYLLVCGCATSGALAGYLLRVWSASPVRTLLLICLVTAGVLALNPLNAARGGMATADAAHAWAMRWDRRDALLREAASRHVASIIVDPEGDIGQVGDLFTIPHAGPNGCYEGYYGIPSISLRHATGR